MTNVNEWSCSRLLEDSINGSCGSISNFQGFQLIVSQKQDGIQWEVAVVCGNQWMYISGSYNIKSKKDNPRIDEFSKMLRWLFSSKST